MTQLSTLLANINSVGTSLIDNATITFGTSNDTVIKHDTSLTPDGTTFSASTATGGMLFRDGTTTLFDVAHTAANTTSFFQTVDFTSGSNVDFTGATVTGLSGIDAGAVDGVFLEYSKSVPNSYTIDNNKVALTACEDGSGITIPSGKTVTVDTGSGWVITGGNKNMGLDAMVATSNQTERTMRTGTIKPTLDETYDIGDSAVVYNIGHFKRMSLKPITTTSRDAMSGIGNGDLIYNSSTNKFQGYANGAWVDLH